MQAGRFWASLTLKERRLNSFQGLRDKQPTPTSPLGEHQGERVLFMLGMPCNELAMQKAVFTLDRFHISLFIRRVFSLTAQTGIGHHSP